MEYPISSNYVSAWTVQDATRELLQNAMDSGEWRVEADGSLVNKGTLRPEHFLLGCSEKTSSDAIGQFGEGLKLALLVLARNGYTVSINTLTFGCALLMARTAAKVSPGMLTSISSTSG